MMIATICMYGLVLESVLVRFPALYLVLKAILLNGKLFGHLDGSYFKKALPPITATKTEVILLQSTAQVTSPTIEGVSTSTEMETSADQVGSLPTPPQS